METLTRAGSPRADRWRHRSGCFRWHGDGRCVDCGAYTGTASDVVEMVTDLGVVYSRPAGEPRNRLARMIERASRFDEAAAMLTSVDGSGGEDVSLTADQLAVRHVWREWRAQQGDPEPDVPRRARRGSRAR